MARLAGRSAPVGLVLEAPGRGRVVARAARPSVTVVGPPSELVLVAFGRQGAAAVTWAGDPDAVDEVRRASFGL